MGMEVWAPWQVFLAAAAAADLCWLADKLQVYSVLRTLDLSILECRRDDDCWCLTVLAVIGD